MVDFLGIPAGADRNGAEAEDEAGEEHGDEKAAAAKAKVRAKVKARMAREQETEWAFRGTPFGMARELPLRPGQAVHALWLRGEGRGYKLYYRAKVSAYNSRSRSASLKYVAAAS